VTSRPLSNSILATPRPGPEDRQRRHERRPRICSACPGARLPAPSPPSRSGHIPPLPSQPCRSPQSNPERPGRFWGGVGAQVSEMMWSPRRVRVARGHLRRAEGCMRSANRHHGLHIGRSPRPDLRLRRLHPGRNLPHVSMVKTAETWQRNQFRAGRLGSIARPLGVSLPNPS